MNEPKGIYLQVGEEYDAKEDEFRDCEEVTWCTDSQFGTDIEYCQITAAELAALQSAADEWADYKATYAAIMAEPAHDDEQHCACVPMMQREIEALREQVTAGKEITLLAKQVVVAYGSWFFEETTELKPLDDAVDALAAALTAKE